MAIKMNTVANRLPLFKLWLGLLGIGLAIGAASGLAVLLNGLIVTNLTNAFPWGLWITIDLSSIALGAGAFTLSAAVYVFGLKKLEAIARAAVFVGLLGYTSAMIALSMDIGRPDRFYHPLIYWNVHSVLWEITLAVILYTTVLMLEFVPIVIESTPLKKFKLLHNLGHFLHRIMPVIAFIGMSISMIHQSSLGATYGIITARPIWYSPSAPVLFILSAIAAGPSLTLFLTLVSSKILGRKLVPADVVKTVAQFIGFACLAYLYLKLWSWAASFYYSRVPERTLSVELLNTNTPYGFTFWWGEVLFGAVVPAIILLWPRLRKNTYLVIVATMLIIGGLVINRWNVTLSGFVVPLDWSPGVNQVMPVNTYVPSLAEWGIAIGIVSFGSMAFTLGLRFLHLYPHAEPTPTTTTPTHAEPIAQPQVETPVPEVQPVTEAS